MDQAGGLLIDVIILGVIRSIISPIAGEDLGEFGPITGIAGVVISAIYFIVAIGQWGTTIGGRVMSIKVVDANGNLPSYGAAAIRWIGAYVSVLIIFIGYLMAFWDGRKQTLHDKFANTFVVKS